MASAAGIVAEAGADIIDINMGCPVKKVRRTGAGAALLGDHELALDIARGAVEGGGGVPGHRQGPLGAEDGWARGLRARAAPGRRGRRRGDRLPPALGADRPQGRSRLRAGARARRRRSSAPMIISGGLADAEAARRAYEVSGADAVMIARGSLGNPWIFEELTGARDRAADRRGGRRRAALGDRPGRRAPRPRARRALPAQVLPVVPRAPGRAARRSRRGCSAATGSRRPRAVGRAGSAPARCCRPDVTAAELTERVERWRDRGTDEDVRGRRIHVFRREGDGPLLLLLHGFPSSSYDWRLLLDEIPDARGAGLRLPRLRPLREARATTPTRWSSRPTSPSSWSTATTRASRSSSSATTWGPRSRPS